jgi:hypothetical protein
MRSERAGEVPQGLALAGFDLDEQCFNGEVLLFE